MFKCEGRRRECKEAPCSQKDEINLTLTLKIEEKCEAENDLKLKKKDLVECKAVQTESRSNN